MLSVIVWVHNSVSALQLIPFLSSCVFCNFQQKLKLLCCTSIKGVCFHYNFVRPVYNQFPRNEIKIFFSVLKNKLAYQIINVVQENGTYHYCYQGSSIVFWLAFCSKMCFIRYIKLALKFCCLVLRLGTVAAQRRPQKGDSFHRVIGWTSEYKYQ